MGGWGQGGPAGAGQADGLTASHLRQRGLGEEEGQGRSEGEGWLGEGVGVGGVAGGCGQEGGEVRCQGRRRQRLQFGVWVGIDI